MLWICYVPSVILNIFFFFFNVGIFFQHNLQTNVSWKSILFCSLKLVYINKDKAINLYFIYVVKVSILIKKPHLSDVYCKSSH